MILAHAGGVDDIAIAIGAVLLFLLFRSRAARRRAEEPQAGPCLYCGRHLREGVERCPECGFRARRAAEFSLRSSASAEER